MHTYYLDQISIKKEYKQYLDIVNLDSIPIPTPICSLTFKRIEDMNPDIAILVWEWMEETSKPKAVIPSKNFKRLHHIHLIALTNINKFENTGKYKQKNHF